MSDKPKNLYVYSVEHPKVKTRGASSARSRAYEIPVEQLQQNFDEFLEGTQSLLEKGVATKGPFEVDTVEVQAEIGADGKIGFLGSGLGVEANASIKFVFKRRNIKESQNNTG